MAISESRERVLFISSLFTSFVRGDIRILKENYHVVVNVYPWHRQVLVPFFFLRQFIFLIRHVFGCKAMMISSGGYWAFLPAILGRLFRKPVYIILNGADCCSLKKFNYGSLRKNPLRTICRLSYQWATGLLPVSASLITTKNTFDTDNTSWHQGYRYYFPKISTPAIVVHNAINNAFWNLEEKKETKQNTFISAFQSSQFLLKGGDMIIELARTLPECSFTIAGMHKPEYLTKCPSNLQFLGFVSQERLRQEYRLSEFYLQLSIFEGFGCALCEAMLCGCIPIVSSVNMLPEIVGDSGYILQVKDSENLHQLAIQAMQDPFKADKQRQAVERITANYSVAKRKSAFTHLLVPA